jgi:hypothetical protein
MMRSVWALGFPTCFAVSRLGFFALRRWNMLGLILGLVYLLYSYWFWFGLTWVCFIWLNLIETIEEFLITIRTAHVISKA